MDLQYTTRFALPSYLIPTSSRGSGTASIASSPERKLSSQADLSLTLLISPSQLHGRNDSRRPLGVPQGRAYGDG